MCRECSNYTQLVVAVFIKHKHLLYGYIAARIARAHLDLLTYSPACHRDRANISSNDTDSLTFSNSDTDSGVQGHVGVR